MADGGGGKGRRAVGAAAARRPGEVTARRLAGLGPEAEALLDALGEVRFLRPDQAAALLAAQGGEAAAARRALTRLSAAGLALTLPHRDRPAAPLVRVWALTPLGARAAAARASHAAGEGGAADPHLARRARALRGDEVAYLFLSHALALSDLYVALVRGLDRPFTWRAGEGCRLRYRSLLAPDGVGVLVPDAVVAPAGLGPGEDALALGGCALEVDRATMGAAAVARKLLRYRELVADRGEFGPILFVAEDASRRRRLGELLAEAGLAGEALDREGAVRAVGAFLTRGQR
jgi:hypothetical protein